jgi:hypothetical protein
VSDVLTKEERGLVEKVRATQVSGDHCWVVIIDRLVAEVDRLRARNEKLERVAKAVDEGACVECENCSGDGHLGRHLAGGKLVACEECGGHEDALGQGFVRSDELEAALAALDQPEAPDRTEAKK